MLGDADKRRKYDELGANWRMYEQAQQQGQSPCGLAAGPDAGVNMGGRAATGRCPQEEMQDLFGNEDPFSDFFHTFFGGAGRRERRRPGGGRRTRGADRRRGRTSSTRSS